MNIIGGLLKKKIIAPMIYSCNTDTEIFNAWLEQSLIPSIPEKSTIVTDNASFHKSLKTREIIEANGHRILFLPPYSPELNPIEGWWAVIKTKIKKTLSDYSSLYDCVKDVFQTI